MVRYDILRGFGPTLESRSLCRAFWDRRSLHPPVSSSTTPSVVGLGVWSMGADGVGWCMPRGQENSYGVGTGEGRTLYLVRSVSS